MRCTQLRSFPACLWCESAPSTTTPTGDTGLVIILGLWFFLGEVMESLAMPDLEWEGDGVGEAEEEEENE